MISPAKGGKRRSLSSSRLTTIMTPPRVGWRVAQICFAVRHSMGVRPKDIVSLPSCPVPSSEPSSVDTL